MTVDDFLALNPGLSREQVREVETSEDENSIDDKHLFDAKTDDCGLVLIQEHPRFVVMQATRQPCVIVTHFSNGKPVTNLIANLRVNDRLTLSRDINGLYYDSYRCCPRP